MCVCVYEKEREWEIFLYGRDLIVWPRKRWIVLRDSIWLLSTPNLASPLAANHLCSQILWHSSSTLWLCKVLAPSCRVECGCCHKQYWTMSFKSYVQTVKSSTHIHTRLDLNVLTFTELRGKKKSSIAHWWLWCCVISYCVHEMLKFAPHVTLIPPTSLLEKLLLVRILTPSIITNHLLPPIHFFFFQKSHHLVVLK